MINKNFFLRVAAISLFALSPVSNVIALEQSSMDMDEPSSSAIYGKLAYHPSYIQSVTISEDVGDVAKPAEKYNLGWLGGAISAGYLYGDFRVELEGVYSQINNEVETNENKPLGNFSYFTGTLNAYYDIAVNDMIMPYVGFGAGMSMLTTKQYTGADSTLPKDVTVYPFTGQLKLGATLNVAGFMPYVGYKLSYFMPVEFIPNTTEGTKKFKFSALFHSLEAGFMIPFAI